MQEVGLAGFRKDVLENVPIDAAGTAVDSWVFRRDAAGAPKGRLVILHGLGDAPVTWFPTIRTAFSEHQIVLPALPGAGRGPLPADHDHLTFQATAAWTQQVLGRLTDDGIPTTIIGHSIGGWLVARALLADPSLAERVHTPILINNAGTWYPTVERERMLLSPRRLEDVDELLAHLYANPPVLPMEALQAMLDTMRSQSYQGLLWSTTETDFLKADELARLPHGTGIIWGLSDNLVPAEAFAALQTNVPDARIIPLEGVGHAPHLEAPHAVVEAISRLLR